MDKTNHLQLRLKKINYLNAGDIEKNNELNSFIQEVNVHMKTEFIRM
jgi:hypothetical protein